MTTWFIKSWEQRHPVPDVGYIFIASMLTTMLLTFGGGGVHFYAFWICGLVIVMIYALKSAVELRVRRDVAVTALCLGGWLAFAIAMSPFASRLSMHLKMTFLTAFYILSVTAAISLLMRNLGSFVKSIRWITLIWMAVNLLLLLAYILRAIDYDNRSFSGMYFNRNTLAVTGCFIFVIWLCIGDVGVRPGKRWIRHIALISVAVLVLSSASMKGLLGLLLALTMYALLRTKGLKGVLLATSLLLIGGSLSVYVEAGKRFQESVLSSQDVRENLERVALFQAGLDLMERHPISGVGVHNSQFFLLTPRHFRRVEKGVLEDPAVGSYSHVNYLEMVLNAGWPAFVLYYGPVLYLLYLVLKTRARVEIVRDIKSFLIILLVMKLAFDFAMVSYYELSHIFALVIAFLGYQRFLNWPRSQVGTRVQ